MSPLPVLSQRERILGGLWGSLIGDALGVPVEFKDRAVVRADPVRDMRGHGTHRQPPGTWSDDGALILCTVESLLNFEFDTDDMARRFVEGMYRGLWTSWGEPFDVGMTTSDSLIRIANGTIAEQAGGSDEYSNGNGSLMRILPVVLRFTNESPETLVDRVSRALAVTHGHERSKMACVFYGLVVRQLFLGCQPQAALDAARGQFTGWYERSDGFTHFRRVLQEDLSRLPEGEVASTGYLLRTLHAGLWCLLTTSSFEECVLKAVNLGGDTDTTACVAGGLAGVHYGLKGVSEKWRRALARHSEVEVLFNRFATLISAPE